MQPHLASNIYLVVINENNPSLWYEFLSLNRCIQSSSKVVEYLHISDPVVFSATFEETANPLKQEASLPREEERVLSTQLNSWPRL